MNDIYALKQMLMEELEGYGRKGELTTGSLDVIDKLSHTVKNLCKIIEEGDYSNEYRDGYSRRRVRYSRAAENMVSELRNLMNDAPNEETRSEFRRLINKIENM